MAVDDEEGGKGLQVSEVSNIAWMAIVDLRVMCGRFRAWLYRVLPSSACSQS